MIDKRDPAALGEVLLVMADLHSCWTISSIYDRSTFRVPDYRDETTIEKYGWPQSIPSTLPN